MSTVPGNPTMPSATDQFRLYDQAVRAWVLRAGETLGTPTFNCVFATPDRAFATLKDLLKKKYGDRSEKVRLMPYPVASIARVGHALDQERFLPQSRTYRGRVYSADQKVSYNAPYPLPWDMTYQIDFWAKNRDTMNAFGLFVQTESTPLGRLMVDFSPVWLPWGEKIVTFDLREITDNSQLEPDEEDRVLRLSATMVLHGWVLSAAKPTPTVLQTLTEVKFYETEDPPEDPLVPPADLVIKVP